MIITPSKLREVARGVRAGKEPLAAHRFRANLGNLLMRSMSDLGDRFNAGFDIARDDARGRFEVSLYHGHGGDPVYTVFVKIADLKDPARFGQTLAEFRRHVENALRKFEEST